MKNNESLVKEGSSLLIKPNTEAKSFLWMYIPKYPFYGVKRIIHCGSLNETLY